MDYDDYAEAQQAATLRQKIHDYASRAVTYGHIDRDWVNSWLQRLGAEPVTGPANYQINAAITGNYGTTITANSRTEALAKFAEIMDTVATNREVRGSRYGQGVYNIEFTGAEPVFFKGPKDVDPDAVDAVPGLDALRQGIRAMLKHGVAEYGWRHTAAVEAIDDMGLEPLPAYGYKTVTVPIGGTAQVSIPTFEDASDEDIQAATAAAVSRAGSLNVTPDEVGPAQLPRSAGAMGWTVVDEDEKDDEDDVF